MNESHEIKTEQQTAESVFNYQIYLCIALNKQLEALEKKVEECQQSYKNLEAKLNKNVKSVTELQTALTNLQRQVDRSLFKRLKKFLKPKLNLDQHPPKPLIFSDKYKASIELKFFPKVSIVTPSYNQGEFIEHTIKSVIEQDYPNIEYIVQDGGSTDNTVEILSKYANQFAYWASAKDGGQTNAINLGFSRTSGDIMAYLNSDDILLPNTIRYVVKYFAEHPEVDAVYGHRVLIDTNDNEVGRWVLPPHNNRVMKWVDYVPQETLFWRRSIWNKVGSTLDENFHFAMDWDLILRLQEAGAKIVRLPRFLAAFRVHHEQKSSAVISQTGYKEMQHLRFRCHKRTIEAREIKRKTMVYLFKHILLQKLYRLGFIKY